jgi:hypothetical protein
LCIVIFTLAADEKTKASGLNGNKHYRSSIFSKCCHIFKGFGSYHYGTILPCILVTRQQHVLSFLCVYF